MYTNKNIRLEFKLDTGYDFDSQYGMGNYSNWLEERLVKQKIEREKEDKLFLDGK